jgi:hypothetical protein
MDEHSNEEQPDTDQPSPAHDGGRSGNGGSPGFARDEAPRDAGDGRPQVDPVLTARFEALEGALHGASRDFRRRPLVWSGVDETKVAIQSIAEALQASVPASRPTTDLPQTPHTDRTEG